MKNKIPLYSSLSLMIVFIILAVFYFKAESAHASTILNENFDSYSTGSVVGQGGWYNLSGSNPAQVTNTQYVSSPNSLTSFPTSGSQINGINIATSSDIYFEADIRTVFSGATWAVYLSSGSGNIGFDITNVGNLRIEGIAGDTTQLSALSENTWYQLNFEAIYNGTGYDIEYFLNGSSVYSTTTTSSSLNLNGLYIQGTGGSGENRFIDNIIVNNSDPNISGVNLTEPIDSLTYAFNPVPFSGTYNNLNTYDYIVFDLNKTDTPTQNVFVTPYPIPPTNGTGFAWNFDRSFGIFGTYTVRARLYDSVNNTYTDWSDTHDFQVGGTTTIEEYGVASSSFATSTAMDSGNLLSYVNVPQLLSTKAPFGYFFEAYSIFSNSISNPVSGSAVPVGDFEIVHGNSTTTIVMFSTSTVSYFLTPSIVAPIRALLVAILYIVTLISIYTIVRHSHLL